MTIAPVFLVDIPCLYLTGRLTVASASLLVIVGGTLSTVFLLPGARKALPLRFDWSIVREAVPFGLKSWAAGLGQFVNVRADQLLMTRLVSPSELGLYAIAVTASGVLVNPFASALAVATVPRFATGDTDLIERTVRVTLLAVLLTSVGVALVSPVVVPLFFGAPWMIEGARAPV